MKSLARVEPCLLKETRPKNSEEQTTGQIRIAIKDNCNKSNGVAKQVSCSECRATTNGEQIEIKYAYSKHTTVETVEEGGGGPSIRLYTRNNKRTRHRT